MPAGRRARRRSCRPEQAVASGTHHCCRSSCGSQALVIPMVSPPRLTLHHGTVLAGRPIRSDPQGRYRAVRRGRFAAVFQSVGCRFDPARGANHRPAPCVSPCSDAGPTWGGSALRTDRGGKQMRPEQLWDPLGGAGGVQPVRSTIGPARGSPAMTCRPAVAARRPAAAPSGRWRQRTPDHPAGPPATPREARAAAGRGGGGGRSAPTARRRRHCHRGPGRGRHPPLC
jgi:hypothetical protein